MKTLGNGLIQVDLQEDLYKINHKILFGKLHGVNFAAKLIAWFNYHIY